MINKSIWTLDNLEKKCVDIPKKVETDILIIGGGITGYSTAYFLKDSSKKITLIDKGGFSSSVTAKSTAKISYLQGTIYQELERIFNREVSRMYFDSQREACSLIHEIVSKNSILCDLEKVCSIIFTLEDAGIIKINKEKELLEEFGALASSVSSEKIKAGIKVCDTYQFHPLKYLAGIKSVINDKVFIYENVLAQSISMKSGKYYVQTDRGVIVALKVIVATHYPFFLIPTFIPLKTYIKREYVSASYVSYNDNYIAISIDSALHSIRFYNNYLIYASNKQRLTSKTDYKVGYMKSRKDFIKYFRVKPEYSFMNQDIMSNDQLPFIGMIRPGLYLATAYNAWGMTNGTIAGKVLADLLIKGKSKYQALFDPKRMNFSLFSSSFIGGFHYAKAYIQSLWKKNKPYYIKLDGILYGLYIDNNNQKHLVKLICPHLKCSLVFNQEEKTWDCPCHGSRFDLDGNILEGPAVFPITKK